MWNRSTPSKIHDNRERMGGQLHVVAPSKTSLRRLTLSVLPAAGMTTGLFLAMAGLIAVDFKPAAAEEARLIGTITPQAIEETEIRKRPKPERLSPAAQPAPPPKFAVQKSDIDLPEIDIAGQVPTGLETDPIKDIVLEPVAISDRDAQPLTPPIVAYPNVAADRGIEGDCQVRFDVDVRGRPYNVKADCTDSLFRREAERAVSRVQFAAKIAAGEAQERRNVVYPLAFRLD